MSTAKTGKVSQKLLSLGRSVFRIIRLLLIILLVAQCALIAVLSYHQDLPVPNFLIQKLNERLSELGLRFESTSIKIDLSGEILIKNSKFYFEDFKEPLITSEAMLANISVVDFIIGRITLEQLKLANSTLYCPGFYSPSGVPEKTIENFYLNLSQERGQWVFHHAQLRSGPLHVTLNGAVPDSLFDFDEEAVDGPPITPKESISLSIHQLLRQTKTYLRNRETLTPIKEPFLHITLEPTQASDFLCHLQLGSRGIILEQGLSTGAITGSVSVEHRNGQSFLLGDDSRLTVDWLRWKEDVQTGTTHLHFPAERIPLKNIREEPPALRFHASALTVFGLKLDEAHGQLNHIDPTNIDLTAFIRQQAQFIQTNLQLRPQATTATLLAEGYWNPKNFLTFDFVKPRPFHQRLIIPDAPTWRAHIELSPQYQVDTVQFEADFDRISYRDVKLVHLAAQGSYHDQKIDIRSARLASERYTVTGSYWQNLETFDYRFLLEGQVDPNDLSSIIVEKWWSNLWPMFEFHSILPQSNIDIRGRYFGGAGHRHIFGHHHFIDTSFRGARLKQFSGTLWGAPDAIRLHNLQAEGTSGGRTDLDIVWDYRKGPQRKYLTAFKGSSSLPLLDAGNMCGQETLDFVSDFDLSGLPQIRAAGVLFGNASEQPGQEFLNIQGGTQDSLIYQDIQFDHLTFKAYKTPKHVRLRNVILGLGGGTAHGKADIFIEKDKQSILQLAADLEGAQFKKLTKAMPTVFEDTSLKNSQAPKHDSLIDLNLRAQGPIGEIWEFTGKGDIRVYEADLGQLHLLGAFSRYLYSVSLNIGTVNFNTAVSDYTLDKGLIHFPNLFITGPSAKISAIGDLLLPEQTLNFNLKLSPFSEVSNPVMSTVLTVFNPVANSIEASLTGTIDEPLYDVDFKPLKGITGTQTPKPPKEQSQERETSPTPDSP